MSFTRKRLIKTALVICLTLFTSLTMVVHAEKWNVQLVSVSGKQITLQSVFKQITEQTGIRFFYSTSAFNDQEKVTVNFSHEKLETVMNFLLKEKNADWLLNENVI